VHLSAATTLTKDKEKGPLGTRGLFSKEVHHENKAAETTQRKSGGVQGGVISLTVLNERRRGYGPGGTCTTEEGGMPQEEEPLVDPTGEF